MLIPLYLLFRIFCETSNGTNAVYILRNLSVFFIPFRNAPYHQYRPHNHKAQAPQQTAQDVEAQERTDFGTHYRRELLGGIAGELSGVEVMLEDRVFRDKPVDYLFGFLPGDFLRRREIGTDHLLDLRFIIRADVDNLDGTHNHRALEGKQEEEEKAYHIADGSECGVPIPAAYQEEKQGKANGSNQDTPNDAAERESEKFEQAPHKRIPPVVCQERLIP